MSQTWFWILFGIGMAFIIWFSWWASLQEKRYHGIYRFFSFTSLLILVLLNLPNWFAHPLAWYQILSWIFLLISLWLAAQGFYLLKSLGRPQGKFENTTRLVDTGLYHYIRHPLYASLFYLGLGVFFKRPTWASALLVLINSLAVLATAKTEEKEMLDRFGDEYTAYRRRTKMFIPYLL